MADTTDLLTYLQRGRGFTENEMKLWSTLPFIVGAFLWFQNPTYISVLFTTQRGRFVLRMAPGAVISPYATLTLGAAAISVPIGIFAASFAIPETGSARAVGTSWSFYAADQIKPLNNLTINLGFRFDREQVDSDGFSQFDPEDEDLAPVPKFSVVS